MSLSAIGRARSGLELARTSLDAAAHNTANALTDGFRRVKVIGAETAAGGVEIRAARAAAPSRVGPTGDLVADTIERKSAAVAYRANLSVVKASDALLGEIIDLVG